MRRLGEIELAAKVALVRCDFNVPIQAGEIADATRIEASLPTLRHVLAAGAGIVALSHLGRPEEGAGDPALSLEPVAARLAAELGLKVGFAKLAEAKRPAAGEVLLLENTRFNPGEKANDPRLAGRYAALGDVFVMDAFASAHRAESSTSALAAQAAERCAGLLLAAELDALGKALDAPRRPLVVVIGGAKVSTKLRVIERLAELADKLIVGGGIANTFLLAQGKEVGASLVEEAMLASCQDNLARHPAKFVLPDDVVIAGSLADAAAVVASDAVAGDQAIFDVGPQSIARMQEVIAAAGTVIWNGALGVFEQPGFAAGTKALAAALAASPAYSLAGGGETLGAINAFGAASGIDYLSTGGGAFLEFVEGRELPGVVALG